MLVGSCYRTDDGPKGSHVVDAPALLSTEEMERFSKHLEPLGITIPDLDKSLFQKDRTFLPALYRLLPESTGPAGDRPAHELRYINSTPSMRAALLDNLEAALSEMGDSSGSEAFRGPYERLVNVVLVASRHGQSIPLELALRVVGRDVVRNLPQLLGKVDLIRWLEDRHGNYLLSARNELEGQILVTAE
ncbi:hypothetical protein [Streptomyces sp. NPDC056669]|uniref:hypothetical protein n=1 Tax=Streptomyces sp. NPDC056669 TaxID=3345903 RepID=UPI00368D07E9